MRSLLRCVKHCFRSKPGQRHRANQDTAEQSARQWHRNRRNKGGWCWIVNAEVKAPTLIIAI